MIRVSLFTKQAHTSSPLSSGGCTVWIVFRHNGPLFSIFPCGVWVRYLEISLIFYVQLFFSRDRRTGFFFNVLDGKGLDTNGKSDWKVEESADFAPRMKKSREEIGGCTASPW